MSENVSRLLEREKEREKILREAQKKKNHGCLLGYFVLAPVLLFIIHIACGGTLLNALGYMKYGLIFAAVVSVLCLLEEKLNPPQGYTKSMEYFLKQLNSEEEQDEFAAQMLGDYGEDTVKCICWKGSSVQVTDGNDIGQFDEMLFGRIWVTKDYVLCLRPGVGSGDELIQLNHVANMELCTKHERRGARSRTRIDFHYIIFHCKLQREPDGKTSRIPDKKLRFEHLPVRDRLYEMIRQMRGPEAEGAADEIIEVGEITSGRIKFSMLRYIWIAAVLATVLALAALIVILCFVPGSFRAKAELAFQFLLRGFFTSLLLLIVWGIFEGIHSKCAGIGKYLILIPGVLFMGVVILFSVHILRVPYLDIPYLENPVVVTLENPNFSAKHRRRNTPLYQLSGSDVETRKYYSFKLTRAEWKTGNSYDSCYAIVSYLPNTEYVVEVEFVETS